VDERNAFINCVAPLFAKEKESTAPRPFDLRFKMAAERVNSPAAKRDNRDFVTAAQKQTPRRFFDRFDFLGLEFNVLLGVVARINEQGELQSHRSQCSPACSRACQANDHKKAHFY